jgi:hypothetical protein
MRVSREQHARQRNLLLAYWIAPPLLWLGQLQLSYALTQRSCTSGSVRLLVLVVVATMLLTGLAGWRALAAWRASERLWPAGEGGATPRAAFASLIGMMICVQMLLVLAVQALAIAIVGPCG